LVSAEAWLPTDSGETQPSQWGGTWGEEDCFGEFLFLLPSALKQSGFIFFFYTSRIKHFSPKIILFPQMHGSSVGLLIFVFWMLS
jgi:hypothetical protein